MKKLIICFFLTVALLIVFTPSVQAKQKLFELPIPVWFSQAIKPFQSALEVLTGKVDNHEARIVELEKKVAELEEKIKQLESRPLNQSLSNGQLSIEGGTSSTTFYTESQGELGIGSQGSNTDNLYILNPPDTSDIKLGEQYQPPTNQSQNQNCKAVGVNGEPLPTPANGQLTISDQVTIVCE